MEDEQPVEATLRRPIQISRLKGAARTLSKWTGLQLSECQEITSRAFGATSWQALLQDPTFVPDESFTREPRGEDHLHDRYQRLQQLLSARLHVCASQALFLAKSWQPTAAQASFELWMRLRGQTDPSNDLEVLQIFGEHPAVPQNVAVVLVQRVDTRAKLLIGVPNARLARFIGRDDGCPLEVCAGLSERLASDWGDVPTSRLQDRLIDIANQLRRKNSIAFAGLGQSGPINPKPPVLLKAQWLTWPAGEWMLAPAFAAHAPWTLEDYPGIAKSASTTFWAMQTPSFNLHAHLSDGTVFFTIYWPGRQKDFHSQVQAGVGGLRYLTPDDIDGPRKLWGGDQPGFFLVKYGNQVRSREPIPGMTEAIATQVRQATGLGEWDDHDSATAFFASDAGLALAKWAATYPGRAKKHARPNAYTGDWMSAVAHRMEFELTRAGALD